MEDVYDKSACYPASRIEVRPKDWHCMFIQRKQALHRMNRRMGEVTVVLHGNSFGNHDSIFDIIRYMFTIAAITFASFDYWSL